MPNNEPEAVDWTAMLKPEESERITLKDTELNTPHTVVFLRVTQTETGLLVATVDCETLEGETLWLRGRYGPQNGLHSLVGAADGGENIEGGTFVYERIPSENSPAGYAHRWTAP